MIQIEFISPKENSLIYFYIIEGACLLFFMFRLTLNFFQKISLNRTIEGLGYSICMIIYIMEIQNSSSINSVVFNIASILRFLPLLMNAMIHYSPIKKTKILRIIPLITNSDRLIEILRQIREMDIIKNDSAIDSQLE